MGSSIHGTLCCSFPLSESYSYFDLYTHFCPFLLQFWYRLGFHCKSETSIQNRSYHPFTLQENILLLNTMGNIHVTCTPLSMLFTTWVSMFNRGIKRQVFGLSHVQTPLPCFGQLLSGSAAGHAKLHPPPEWISEADGLVIKNPQLCNCTYTFSVVWIAFEFSFWCTLIYILPLAWPESFLKFSQLCQQLVGFLV